MRNYYAKNIKKNIRVPFLMLCYYVTCMLYSLHAYMFWHIDNTVLTLIIVSATILVHIFYAKFYLYKNMNIALFAILAVLLGTHGNINGYFLNVVNIFPFLSFLFLKDNYKYSVFFSWRKVFNIIIAVSLICYIMVTIGVNFPYMMDFYGDTTSDSYYLVKNYFVFVQLSSSFTEIPLERFLSIFLEPGYLACLIVMIFFIDGFKFKKHKSNFVLLAALILTFSIAGYILFVIFYLIRKMKDSKYRLLSILGVLGLVCAIYLYGTFYNGGDNEINNQVLARFQYDEQRGTLAGYNRTTEAFDAYFNKFISSSSVFVGDPKSYNRLFQGGGANVGIKYYIMVYGLLGLFAYCLFLYSPFVKVIKKSYLTLSFMLLWFIIFARGNFVMWMSAFLITYVFGLISIQGENTK